MRDPPPSRDDLDARIERRLGVLPHLYLALSDPAERAALWAQAEAAYLDNPLPSIFKERLLAYLARFSATRRGLERHLASLMRRPAGDATASPHDADASLALIEHRLPSGEELAAALARLHHEEGPRRGEASGSDEGLRHGDTQREEEPWPEPGSLRELDRIACAAHLYLRSKDRPRCRAALRAALSRAAYDHLLALLGYAQLERSWLDEHPELVADPDVEAVLAGDPRLARWIDARWPGGGERPPVDEAPGHADARFRLALEAARAMVYESDLERGRIVAAIGLEHLLGEPEGSMPRRSAWLERVHPEDLVAVTDDLALDEDGFRLHYRVRHRDGRWVYVVEHGRVLRDDRGRPVGHIGVVIDVTELHRIEVALASRTAELETIVDHMADGVVVLDAEGRIDRINRAARASPARAICDPEASGERHLVEGAEGRPLPLSAWPSAKARRFEAFTGEEITLVERTTGRRFTALFSGVAVPDDEGHDRAFVITFRDVTDRVEAAEALRASEQRLRELSQRKDEFLAMLGHELRNPLSSIRSAADMLHLLPMEDHRVERLRRVLDRQSAHMAKLVDGLLDAARVVRGKVRLEKERVNLRDVTLDLVADRRSEAEDLGVDLAVGGGGHDVWVLADRLRMTQILDNLVSNALKYNRPGGHVAVEVEREGEEAVLRVRDDGVGMAPELVAQLFEPFQQGPQAFHRPEGGLGLGLAVVRGLVERHGGQISASSEGLGRGSTFEVRLPAAAPPDARPRAEAQGDHALAVLVVEDERDYADTLRMLLETLGHRVEVARDGREAIVRARAQPPDVVLCDVGLPDMSGYQVAAALSDHDETRDAYLVALTGFSRTEDRERAERAGFDDFIAKPAGADAIQAALRRGRPA